MRAKNDSNRRASDGAKVRRRRVGTSLSNVPAAVPSPADTRVLDLIQVSFASRRCGALLRRSASDRFRALASSICLPSRETDHLVGWTTTLRGGSRPIVLGGWATVFGRLVCWYSN